LFADAKEQKAIGEASAIYLSSYYPERTAARIRDRIPHAKLIALLRQPADRAYSAYNFYHAREIEPIGTFAGALAAEAGRFEAECPDIRHRANGCYYTNLKPYYDTFPREQIRVYLQEDWSADPGRVLHDIFEFLKVDTGFQVKVERRNVTTLYKSKRLRRLFINPNRVERWVKRLLPDSWLQGLEAWNERATSPFPPGLRRELTESFQPDILALQGLIHRDLSHWLGDPSGPYQPGGRLA
jgi:hypothetical protein